MTLTATSAQAQNWLDALKGVATTAIDKVTGGQLTANKALVEYKYVVGLDSLGGDIYPAEQDGQILREGWHQSGCL